MNTYTYVHIHTYIHGLVYVWVCVPVFISYVWKFIVIASKENVTNTRWNKYVTLGNNLWLQFYDTSFAAASTLGHFHLFIVALPARDVHNAGMLPIFGEYEIRTLRENLHLLIFCNIKWQNL